MSFVETRVEPTNGKVITFSGELIARSASDPISTTLGVRYFDLRVYKEAGAGYVPVIDFHSTCEGEANVTISERVDRSHDIENFYFVFEPCEVMPENVLKVMPTEQRQQLLKTILKLYDAQVNRVLLLVKQYARHAEDDKIESSQSKKSGLLSFFDRTP